MVNGKGKIMNNEELSKSYNRKREIIKKIIIWIIVIFITLMLVLLVIFQPRFFTFLD